MIHITISNKVLYIIILSILCHSCGDVKNNQQKYHDIVSVIKTDYDIKYCWDTLYYEYSIDYNKVTMSPYQIIDEIYIIDIFKKDSLNIVYIVTGYYEDLYFDLAISDNELVRLRDYLTESEYDDDLDIIFVVSIDDLKKMRIQIYNEYDADENYVDIDVSENHYSKGRIEKVYKIN